MKKIILAVAVAAVASMAFIVFAVPAMAGNGATIKDMTSTPVPQSPIYHRVRLQLHVLERQRRHAGLRADLLQGSHYAERCPQPGLKGIVANDTGAPVTYSANSGGPIPAGQQCWDFDNGNLSTDWSMTIDADGKYTLNCHFAKA